MRGVVGVEMAEFYVEAGAYGRNQSGLKPKSNWLLISLILICSQ